MNERATGASATKPARARRARSAVRGAAVVLVTTGLLVAGGGVALADDPEPTPPPITLTPEESAWVCDERIPDLLDRIARLQTRIGADADTPGSTARLEQRLQQARDAGRTEAVDRI